MTPPPHLCTIPPQFNRLRRFDMMPQTSAPLTEPPGQPLHPPPAGRLNDATLAATRPPRPQLNRETNPLSSLAEKSQDTPEVMTSALTPFVGSAILLLSPTQVEKEKKRCVY
ncbi:protein of unknown function [Candidatus Promineifilum breve]|uniref:Uncharacterized protein n=1 Tax=Candidatus Promineifilum breve TaxID=1806508 RepID=A0A160T7B6_9CHLR|nr:protein of unknown function [Candidatus Promineifilum breve]